MVFIAWQTSSYLRMDEIQHRCSPHAVLPINKKSFLPAGHNTMTLHIVFIPINLRYRILHRITRPYCSIIERHSI